MTVADGRSPRRSKDPRAQFGVDFDYSGETTSVLLYGELDALSAPAFRAALLTLSDRENRVVSIDLSRLVFCNIGGLRAMAELAAQLHAVGGRVEIVGHEVLTKMLEISDLASMFTIREYGVGNLSRIA
jgi:anti-anti-sigma factor